MSQEILLPDIGDVSEVEVIEIPVEVGQNIDSDETLLVLESDKATMDIPAPSAGVIKEIKVSIGDKISQGTLIAIMDSATDSASSQAPSNETAAPADAEAQQDKPAAEQQDSSGTEAGDGEVIDITVPDIGDIEQADVIEVCVSEGDSVEAEASLIVLETDKATMDVPCPAPGVIQSLSIKVGDKVSKGSALGAMKTTGSGAKGKSAQVESVPAAPQPAQTDAAPKQAKKAPVPDVPTAPPVRSGGKVHASPAVRRFARELGADVTKVSGSGPKGRVLKEDVQKFIKYELSRPKATAATGAFAMPQMPKVDHAKWGDVEQVPLSRIQKISSVNLHRNWITIPHVTQHEEADITELEAFRKSMKDEAAKQGVRLTPLAFIMKAVVASLKAFPTFNASLAEDGENLILKKYYNVGMAVDTPNGLVVPVIRDVDKKSVLEIASDMGEISAKARDGKLGADGMQGGCFTISSLGGIGGTAFTPIVNWPDVAILGLSKNQMKPVWNGKEFEPRLMLPMSLSYDHRVIDGAVAARFAVHLAQNLADIRRLIL